MDGYQHGVPHRPNACRLRRASRGTGCTSRPVATSSKTVTPEIVRTIIRKMGVDIPGVHFRSTAEHPIVAAVKAPPRRRRGRVPAVLLMAAPATMRRPSRIPTANRSRSRLPDRTLRRSTQSHHLLSHLAKTIIVIFSGGILFDWPEITKASLRWQGA
jgi:hypothetical protein